MKYGHRQKGIAAIIFVIIFPFFLGFFALTVEGTRYLTESARLSDVLESASLAVAASVNHDDDKAMVQDYITATVPQADVKLTDITITSQTCEQIYGSECGKAGVYDKSGLRFNQYRLQVTSHFVSWFPGSDLVVGFNKDQTLSNQAVARKYQQKSIDVVFATDFSGSMNELWNGKSKYYQVIETISKIMKVLERYNQIAVDKNIINHIGIVPYSLYTSKLDNYLYDNWISSSEFILQDYGYLPIHKYELFNMEPGDYMSNNLSIPSSPERPVISPSFFSERNIDMHNQYPDGLPFDSNYLYYPPGSAYKYTSSDVAGIIKNTFGYYDNAGRNSGYYGWRRWSYNQWNKSNINNYINYGYYYKVPLSKNFDNIQAQIDNFFPSGGTSSIQGVIGAARMLDQAHTSNKDKLIIVLSDGLDNDPSGLSSVPVTSSRSYYYYMHDLCGQLRQHFREKGETLKIAAIGFTYNVNNNLGLKHCTNQDKIYNADNDAELYNTVLNLIVEEIGHLYNHDYKVDKNGSN